MTGQTGSDELLPIKRLADDIILIRGGTFRMGTESKGSWLANLFSLNSFLDEQPAHDVTLSDFYLCKYQLTQDVWEMVMGYNPSHFKGVRRPVENVSWDDCQQFLARLRGMTGQPFRLPTEAEWEYAARGGLLSRGCQYAGSNHLDAVAWFERNSQGQTQVVGTRQPNELGLYDMSGNVWEWCQDIYGSYKSKPQVNPTGRTSGMLRVYRGGGWNNDAGNCRVAIRNAYTSSFRNNFLGLRLAL